MERHEIDIVNEVTKYIHSSAWLSSVIFHFEQTTQKFSTNRKAMWQLNISEGLASVIPVFRQKDKDFIPWLNSLNK